MGDVITFKVTGEETGGKYSVWEIEVPEHSGLLISSCSLVTTSHFQNIISVASVSATNNNNHDTGGSLPNVMSMNAYPTEQRNSPYRVVGHRFVEYIHLLRHGQNSPSCSHLDVRH